MLIRNGININCFSASSVLLLTKYTKSLYKFVEYIYIFISGNYYAYIHNYMTYMT